MAAISIRAQDTANPAGPTMLHRVASNGPSGSSSGGMPASNFANTNETAENIDLPEPGTLALFAGVLGMLGWITLRRRRPKRMFGPRRRP
ncbi:MAG: PEP-CTERM sorting domain-containing protein [Alphaproteobacteria bacterium]|nr:PEP-CTERM sorting domain-containing protein [Alphaproteobacteria bacterium]